MEGLFDQIYCINLDKRADRWKFICEPQFKKHKLDVQRVSAIDGKELRRITTGSSQFRGRIGCAMSHLKVLRLIKESNASHALILEDDALFADDFVASFQTLIHNVPNNWDMIFLGANCIKYTPIGNGIIKLNRAYTTHAYMVSSHMIDELIDLVRNHIEKWTLEGKNTPHTALDVIYADIMPRFNVYGLQKALVTQIPSVSDIEGKYVNYTGVIR